MPDCFFSFSHLGFWRGILGLIASFPDHCVRVLFFEFQNVLIIIHQLELRKKQSFMHYAPYLSPYHMRKLHYTNLPVALQSNVSGQNNIGKSSNQIGNVLIIIYMKFVIEIRCMNIEHPFVIYV